MEWGLWEKNVKKVEPAKVETTVDPVITEVQPQVEEPVVNEEVNDTEDNSLLGFAKTIAGE